MRVYLRWLDDLLADPTRLGRPRESWSAPEARALGVAFGILSARAEKSGDWTAWRTRVGQLPAWCQVTIRRIG
jgi:hypothetical protein